LLLAFQVQQDNKMSRGGCGHNFPGKLEEPNPMPKHQQLVRLPKAFFLSFFIPHTPSLFVFIKFREKCDFYAQLHAAIVRKILQSADSLSALWTHLLPLLRYKINFYALLPQEW